MNLYFLPKSFRLKCNSDGYLQIRIRRNEFITFIEDFETSTFYASFHDDSYISDDVFMQLDRLNNKKCLKRFCCMDDDDVVLSKQQLRFTQYIMNGI